MCYIHLLIYTHVIQITYGRMRIWFRIRQGRPRKHDLSHRTRAPPTTSTAPVSTTPTTTTTSTIFGHSPHIQEFVIIPNLEFVELGPQPSFTPQPSPPPPPGGEAHTLPILDFTPSPSSSQSQGAQASLSTPSWGSTNDHVENLDIMVNPSK